MSVYSGSDTSSDNSAEVKDHLALGVKREKPEYHDWYTHLSEWVGDSDKLKNPECRSRLEPDQEKTWK